MARAIWSGAISFGLVMVPVKVYSAVSRKDVRFNQLHGADGGRIQQKRVCAVDGEEVPYEEIVKGYEIEPGRYVTITPAELDSVAAERTRRIEIEEFVALDDIDPIHWESTYYLAPDKTAGKPYALLLAALESTSRVGLGRVVLRSKEYLAAIRPARDALMLSTMSWLRSRPASRRRPSRRPPRRRRPRRRLPSRAARPPPRSPDRGDQGSTWREAHPRHRAGSHASRARVARARRARARAADRLGSRLGRGSGRPASERLRRHRAAGRLDAVVGRGAASVSRARARAPGRGRGRGHTGARDLPRRPGARARARRRGTPGPATRGRVAARRSDARGGSRSAALAPARAGRCLPVASRRLRSTRRRRAPRAQRAEREPGLPLRRPHVGTAVPSRGRPSALPRLDQELGRRAGADGPRPRCARGLDRRRFPRLHRAALRSVLLGLRGRGELTVSCADPVRASRWEGSTSCECGCLHRDARQGPGFRRTR